MSNLLNQIRGVVGVTGVVLYKRQSGDSDAIMPANFEDNRLTELKEKFTGFSYHLSGESSVRIKLSKGWAIIKSIGQYSFLILAREDLNVSTLNLVMKSVALALQQETPAEIEESEPIQFDLQSVFILLEAVNMVRVHFADSLSRFRITQLLRETKSELMTGYPVLKHFSVDPNGEVILIKGSESQIDVSMIEAIARWLVEFKNRVRAETVIAGFDLQDITREISFDLERMQFYRFCKKAMSAQKV